MHSGEYNVFDVTLSVYTHRAGSKVSLTTMNLGTRLIKSSTFDTNVFYDHNIFVFFDVMYSGE
jgi:hypothetical protein